MKMTRIAPPATVKGDARDEWNRTVKAITKLGRKITPADVALLTLYCQAWQLNRDCLADVTENGSTTERPSGAKMLSPSMRSYLETSKLLRGFLADLRLTPASRKNEQVEEAEELTV